MSTHKKPDVPGTTPVRGMKRTIRKEDTRRMFIDAALQLMEAQGVEALSVRRLSEMTGYSFPALYNYFPNMTCLYQHCIHVLLEDMLTRVTHGLPADPDSAWEQVLEMSRRTLDYWLERPLAFELVFMVKLEAPPPEEIRDALMRPPIIQHVRRALEKLMKQRAVPDSEWEAWIQLVLSHMAGRMMAWIRRTQEADADRFRSAYLRELELLLGGMTRETGTGVAAGRHEA